MLVEELGMGGDFSGVRCFTDQQPGTGRQAGLSELALDRLDKAIQQLLDQARTRAAELLEQHQPQLERLRGLLLERKTISAADLPDLLA
jgi:ATP-dependent Zn protease